MVNTLKVSDLQPGDILSEHSIYKVISKTSGNEVVSLEHLQTGKIVNLQRDYIETLVDSAEQYFSEIEVGKEDKFWTSSQIQKFISSNPNAEIPIEGSIKVKGIRTIFNEISKTEVFTVIFTKADKKKTKAEILREKEEYLNTLLTPIQLASSRKKNTVEAAKTAILTALNNPFQETIKGEDRTLRGCKAEMYSLTGHYRCIDLDLQEERLVNINTIKTLVYKGVKYNVK